MLSFRARLINVMVAVKTGALTLRRVSAYVHGRHSDVGQAFRRLPRFLSKFPNPRGERFITTQATLSTYIVLLAMASGMTFRAHNLVKYSNPLSRRSSVERHWQRLLRFQAQDHEGPGTPRRIATAEDMLNEQLDLLP